MTFYGALWTGSSTFQPPVGLRGCSRIAIDIYGLGALSIRSSYQGVLSVQDSLNNYKCFFPIKTKISAEIVRVLRDKLFAAFGFR